jgi:hypothetical protein
VSGGRRPMAMAPSGGGTSMSSTSTCRASILTRSTCPSRATR